MLYMDFPLYWRPPLQGNFFLCIVCSAVRYGLSHGGYRGKPFDLQKM